MVNLESLRMMARISMQDYDSEEGKMMMACADELTALRVKAAAGEALRKRVDTWLGRQVPLIAPGLSHAIQDYDAAVKP